MADANGYSDGASLLSLIGHRYGRALIEALPEVEHDLGMMSGALQPLAPTARPGSQSDDRDTVSSSRNADVRLFAFGRCCSCCSMRSGLRRLCPLGAL